MIAIIYSYINFSEHLIRILPQAPNFEYPPLVGASALQSVDYFLFPCRVIPTTVKTEFTTSLFDAWHEGDTEEKKPESVLFMPLGQTFNGIPPSICGRQEMGSSNLSARWPRLTKDLHIQHNLIRANGQLQHIFKQLLMWCIIKVITSAGSID